MYVLKVINILKILKIKYFKNILTTKCFKYLSSNSVENWSKCYLSLNYNYKSIYTSSLYDCIIELKLLTIHDIVTRTLHKN